MSKLKNIDIGMSPLTNNIYLGYGKNGVFQEKIDITENMIIAVGDLVSKTKLKEIKLNDKYKLTLKKIKEEADGQ